MPVVWKNIKQFAPQSASLSFYLNSHMLSAQGKVQDRGLGTVSLLKDDLMQEQQDLEEWPYQLEVAV